MSKLCSLGGCLLGGSGTRPAGAVPWDQYGRLLQSGKLRELIPALVMLDFKFDRRPRHQDVVLIPHDRSFVEREDDGIGIVQFDDVYDIIDGSFDGWGKLYLSLENPSTRTRQAARSLQAATSEHAELEKDSRNALYLRGEREQNRSVSTAVGEATIYRTGLVGKPSSWHLIEAECGRRWRAGERHPGRSGESRSEWARVLVEWLKTEHNGAPKATEKTVTNKIGGLLRDLAANDA